MKTERDIILEIVELENWLTLISKENLAEENNWSLILTLKSKIEALAPAEHHYRFQLAGLQVVQVDQEDSLVRKSLLLSIGK